MSTQYRQLIELTAEDQAIASQVFEGVEQYAYEDSDLADAGRMLGFAQDRIRFDFARPRERILLALS